MKKHIDTKYVGMTFIEFVRDVKNEICKIDDSFEWRGLNINIDFDPQNPENIEELMLTGWNSMAQIWPAIEADGNYTATVTSMIEKIFQNDFPVSRKLRILSLGAGPGLYEIFIAHCLKSVGVQSRIFSTDYAKNMIDFQHRILDSNLFISRSKVSSLCEIVSPRVVDMTDLSEFRNSIDIIICNNALQWVKEWQTAIFEMGQSMRTNGLKQALFFVHPHAMRLSVGGNMIQRDHIEIDSLFDVLNKEKFSPVKTRLMMGGKGSGQSGAPMNRMMVEAKFYPKGVKTHWRKMSSSIAGMKAMEIPR
jgi:SAM-dependent methyltransferase